MSELGPQPSQPDIPDYAKPAIDGFVRVNGEAPSGEELNRILAFLGSDRSTATDEELIEFLNRDEF